MIRTRQQRAEDRQWFEQFKDYEESDFPIDALIVVCSAGGLLWIVAGLVFGWFA